MTRFLPLFALLALQPTAQALLVVDDFSTYHTVSVAGPPSGPASTFSAQITLESLGGERDILIDRTSNNSGAVAVDISGSVASQLSYASAPFTSGSLLLTYDGSDNSSAIDYMGLGGIDITQGGTNQGMLLRSVSDLGASITFTIYTDADHFSSATLPILADPTFTFADYFSPFASFVSQGALGGATFTNVGAITLFLNGATAGTDVSLETVFAAPTPVPEPSGGLLVLTAAMWACLMRRR